MHTHSFTRRSAYFAISSIAIFAGALFAQLGPQPTEIPAAETAEISEPIQTPSQSQRARPVLDELLLAQAQAQAQGQNAKARETPQVESATQAATPDTTRVFEPIGSPAFEPTSLAGSNEEPAPQSVGGFGFGSLGEGWTQTVIALSGVILLILGLGQLYKRLARTQGGLAGQLGAGGSAPTGLLEVIGRYPISGGMSLVVLKFDRRVLLLSNAAPVRGKNGRGGSMQTLCELDDPEDVASVLLKARSASGETIAHSFERALQEADDLTDESLHEFEPDMVPRVRARPPIRSSQPMRTITSDEGDRAELWSGGSDGQAAANVLRRRLATMRRGGTL